MQTLRPACRSLQLFSWHSCAVRCASISNSTVSTVGKQRECDVAQLPFRDVNTLPYFGGYTFKDCCSHVQKSHMSTSAEGFCFISFLQNHLLVLLNSAMSVLTVETGLCLITAPVAGAANTPAAAAAPSIDAGAVPAADVKSGSKKHEVSRDDVLNLMKEGALHLYDVREPKEVEESGCIPGALNIPLTSLKASLSMDEEQFKETFKSDKPAKESQNIVFFGFSSVKSSTALEIAHKIGFKKAKHYPGGWEEWSRFEKKS